MNVSTNFKTIEPYIKSLPKQFNYGAMLGINKIAEHIRDSELSGAKSSLTLRGTWWKPRSMFGFNVQYAKKGSLSSSVFTRADWLQLHAIGGVKVGRGMIAIPTDNVKRSKRDMITRANRPRNIKGAFKTKIGGKDAIVKKQGRGSNKKLVVLYWLEKRANIKREYDFYGIGQKVFDRNAKRYIQDGINQAIRSAR